MWDKQRIFHVGIPDKDDELTNLTNLESERN